MTVLLLVTLDQYIYFVTFNKNMCDISATVTPEKRILGMYESKKIFFLEL